MRVTSAPASASSQAAVAASFAFSEPARSDPGITRIFRADIGKTRWADAAGLAYQPLRYTQTRAGGRFIQMRSEASVDTPGSDFGIGGATEYVNCTNGAPGASAMKASRISLSRVSIGLVTSGKPETTAAAGALSTFRRESRKVKASPW